MIRLVKLMFFLVLFSFQFLVGQTAKEISNINVDDWSDKKIERFWNSAKSKGYTMVQVESLLKTRGVPQYQIEKLKERVASLDSQPLTKSGEIKVSEVKTHKEEAFGVKGKVTAKVRDSLYGYSFFNNPKISFVPNINVATPQNYQLGPGDVVQVDVWGAAEASYQKKIDKQGRIKIEGIGSVNLNGLNFEAASSKIKSYLRRIYSGIGASNNSYNKVYVGVSLAKVRTVQVNLVGEVKIPGTYSVSAMATVLNALYAAGGPTKDGNFRSISLVRYGKKISDFDFYQYLQKGSEKGNLTLQDQDVIIVSPYKNLVTVGGAVKRPGFYQMKDGESMKDLFEYCGGFTADAYKNSVVVERIKGMGREIMEVSFNKMAVEKSVNGDVVKVKKITGKFDNGVSIFGAVYLPGNYAYKNGMTVGDLIKKASGLKNEAFLKRGLITRYKNEVDREVIAFSLENDRNVVLKSNDEVTIYSKNDLRGKREVTINGAVNTPKTIDYAEGMTIEDLIVLAGGLKEGADAKNIEVSRRMKDGSFETLGEVFKLSSSGDLAMSNSGFVLSPNDVVSVRYLKGYTKQKNVIISGEVESPGRYMITSKNERISDLIKRAGGVSPYAYVEGATLIRKKEAGKLDEKQDVFLKELEEAEGAKSSSQKEFRIGVDLKKILDGNKGVKDLILQQGDELIIPTIKQTVEVRGEVYSPSLVQFVRGKSLKYYVNHAGGFSHNAKRNRAYVVYGNGDVNATKRILFINNYPEVKPGSTILVPKREERQRVSAQEVIGITTGVATLGILIDRLIDKN